jgi:hypothetical protein
LGIINTTKEALTPQQKVLAAQALIYEQTGAAQGDFERTSDGLANKTRILTAQLENAKVTIGEALLPIVLELANFFSQKVIPIVQKVSEAFSSKADGMGGTLTNLAQGIKNFVQPIFEGFKSAFDRIKNTIIENRENFESFFEVIQRLAPVIGTIIGGAIKVLAPIAETVLNIFSKILGAIAPLLNDAIDGINIVIRGLNLINPGTDIKYLSKIGATGVVTGFSGTTPGGQAFSGTLPSANVTGSNVINQGLDPVNVAKYSTDPVARAAAQKIVDEMTFNLRGRTDAANQAKTMAGLSNAGAAFTSTGAFDKNGTTINLTVNGAIDSEGTARTIIDTLNNSYYRGTNGATNLVTA